MKYALSRVAAISALWIGAASAQSPVTHQGLEADFYNAEGETAVLLLHGTLAHNRMEIIETVATLVSEDYGHPVLAPNLSYREPGREGMLDCGITHRHKDTEAVSEIAQWVQYLEDQGYSNIVVSAHSRGGAQTSAYLAQGGSPSIKGAVLIAPATYNAEASAAGYESRYGAPLSDLLAKARVLAGDAVMDVPGFVYCENAKVTAESFLDYYTPRDDRDTPTNLKSVQVPVIVVAGSEDDVVADLPDRLAHTSGLDERVQLVMLDGADHFFRDLYADDVAAAIADMVEAQ